MQLLGTQTLHTKRLTLRQFNTTDINASFTNWTNDATMCTYLSWQAHTDQEESNHVITHWISNYNDPNFLQWAIVLNDIHQVIGTISATAINEALETIELGYCIGSKFWHHGYTSEALSSVLDYLFRRCNVNRICAKHAIENSRSGNVLQRCGMYYEGSSRQSYKNNRGNYIDMVHYGLTKYQYVNDHSFDHKKYHAEIIANCNALLNDDYVLSNLSNVVSYLFEKIHHLNWIGYYFLINNELVLGPFQGKIACNPLTLSKGVCAKCATSQQVVVANDVHQVPDHIACDSASNSELVLPLFNHNGLIGVLDVDSPIKDRFDQKTVDLMIDVSKILSNYLKNHH